MTTEAVKNYYEVINNVEFTAERISPSAKDYQRDCKCKKYIVTIKRNNKTFKTFFYQGSAITEPPTLLDLLYDMQVNDISYYHNAQEWANEFGYGSLYELKYPGKVRVLDIYIKRKKETRAFCNMFTGEERDIIREHLESIGY